MAQLFWDTLGYVHDQVPRWAKLTVALLVLATVGFFFGYRAALYVLGGSLWAVVAFLIIGNIYFVIKHSREKRRAAPTPLTPADQEDVAEFQAAMQGTEVAQAPVERQPYLPPLNEQQVQPEQAAPEGTPQQSEPTA